MIGVKLRCPQGIFLTSIKTNSKTRNHPNVLIVVFDAWSALDCSLYGYPRDTTPNIKRLAEKATIYHNHYAAGYMDYSWDIIPLNWGPSLGSSGFWDAWDG